MLTDQHIKTVQATIPLLQEAGTAITEHFYNRMFTHNPELKDIFNLSHQHSGRQPAALFDAVAAYAMNIENLAALSEAVERIAQKHTSFDVQPEQYAVVGHHLIETLRELAGDAFTPEVEEAWGAAYGLLADIFIKREGEIYAENADANGGWSGARKFRLVNSKKESDLVRSLVFEPVDEQGVVPHKPGQYLGIRVDVPGHEFREIRQYSVSHAPNDKNYRISVKRESANDDVPGIVSNFLHDGLQHGDEVELFAPAGDFYLKHASKPLALISAGVGLTPMQSMLETLAADQHPGEVHYLHACENESQHSFASRVDDLKETLNLKAHTWYRDGAGDNGAKEGLMQLEAVKDELPVNDGEFYLCGPVPFMRFAKEQLVGMGVDDGRIHYEVFGPHDAF